MAYPDVPTTSGRTYTINSFSNGNALYTDFARSTNQIRKTLEVATTPAKGQKPNRVLVRISSASMDSLGNIKPYKVHTVLEFPQSVVTLAEIQEVVAELGAILTATNVEALYKGAPLE